jgi:RNA polymerase sigma factor (sigma-70 family)
MESRHDEFSELLEGVKEELTRQIKRDVDEGDKRADVLSDVLYVAWSKFDEFESGTNFRAWIYAIYRNLKNEYWRKLTEARARLPRKNSGDTDDSSGDDDDWKSDALESGLTHDHIEIGRFEPDTDVGVWSTSENGTAQSDEDDKDPDSIAAQPTEDGQRAIADDGFVEIDDGLAVNFNLSILDSKMEGALKLLTGPERQVFLERNNFGHTLEEVAKNLGLKIDSVKAYHSTALKKVQSQLSFDFYKSYPDLMTAGLVAFPSEHPVSFVSYMLMGLMERYLQRFDPTDQKLWDESVKALRSRISGGRDRSATE